MDDFHAWRDWVRVQACLTYGVRRWMWFALAAWGTQRWVDDVSTPLVMVADMAVFGAQLAWMRRVDARYAANITTTRRAGD